MILDISKQDGRMTLVTVTKSCIWLLLELFTLIVLLLDRKILWTLSKRGAVICCKCKEPRSLLFNCYRYLSLELCSCHTSYKDISHISVTASTCYEAHLNDLTPVNSCNQCSFESQLICMGLHFIMVMCVFFYVCM